MLVLRTTFYTKGGLRPFAAFWAKARVAGPSRRQALGRSQIHCRHPQTRHYANAAVWAVAGFTRRKRGGGLRCLCTDAIRYNARN